MALTMRIRSRLCIFSKSIMCSYCLRDASSIVKLAYAKYDKETSASASHRPLVILHGLFGQKQNWHSVAKALNKRLQATVFAVDLRNHGNSPWTDTMSYDDMAADVCHFLRQVVPQETNGLHTKVHLIGHSMGGKTAMTIALSSGNDNLLESVIIEDTAPKDYDSSSHQMFPVYLKAMMDADLSEGRRHVNAQLEPVISNLSIRQFLLTNLIRDNDSWRWKLNLRTIDKFLYDVLKNQLSAGQFNGQTLFISGSESPYVSVKDHPIILNFFPKAQFIVVKGSGHWVHAEKSHDFIFEVAKFIEGL